MKKSQAGKTAWLFLFLALTAGLQGCASAGAALGFKKLEVPPEYNQKVLLEVTDEYQDFQATRSGYDVGDLQNLHSQHTFPIVIEDAFKEMFGQVEFYNSEAGIQTSPPDVPAIFEAKIIDLANDIYDGGENYRGQVTLAVAMKSPEGELLWQKAFRGEGYAIADNQFGSNLGPQDAVIDAMRDALDQMQQAIVNSPEVRTHMKFYKASDAARKEKEVQI